MYKLNVCIEVRFNILYKFNIVLLIYQLLEPGFKQLIYLGDIFFYNNLLVEIYIIKKC